MDGQDVAAVVEFQARRRRARRRRSSQALRQDRCIWWCIAVAAALLIGRAAVLHAMTLPPSLPAAEEVPLGD